MSGTLALWLHLALLALTVANAALVTWLHYHMVEAMLDRYDPERRAYGGGDPSTEEPE